MAYIFIGGKFRETDAGGAPLAGGLLYTYVAGTLTPLATYTDAGGATANANPVVLDSAGRANVFLGTSSYRMILKTPGGTTLWDEDNLVAPLGALAVSTGASLVGTLQAGAGAIARSAQDKLRDQVSVKDFGAVGDGASHPLSAVSSLGGSNTSGWTLAQWQALWPHVTALTNQLDWASSQAAVNTGRAVFFPDASYLFDQPLKVSTYNQRVFGNGRLATITFALAAAGGGIVLTGSSGRQQVFGLNLVGSTNCTKVIDYSSPQIQIMYNWITPGASGSTGLYGENENTGAGIYDFGAQICFNFIHGSFTTGSRGIRLGNNSQTTLVFGNVIENLESGLSMDGACDSVAVEANVFENMMSTGYGIDMRGTAGSPTYKNIVIRGNHFEDVYGAVAWGNNALGPTYTSNHIASNFVSGHGGGTTYALSIVGLCGAGSANNAVEFNDATNANGTTAVTAFFNLNDANGASSVISRRGNTVASGAWAAGPQAALAYSVRQTNGYFGNVVVSGAFTSVATTRIEVGNVTFRLPLRWEPGEYLDSLQFVYLPIGSTPSINATIVSVNGDTVSSIASSGVTTGTNGVKKTIIVPVNAVAVAGSNYYVEYVCSLAGGATAYVYPQQAFLRV